MGQATVPDESRADVSVHGLWKWGTTAFFDMRIVNLYVRSYLRQTCAKALEMADMEKKDKYLHPCMEHRRSFTLMVYSMGGITGTEAVAAQKRLALLLSNKLQQEYLEICGFVRDWMSPAIVISNTLLLRSAQGQGGVHTIEAESGGWISDGTVGVMAGLRIPEDRGAGIGGRLG